MNWGVSVHTATLDIAEFRKHVHALAMKLVDHKVLSLPHPDARHPCAIDVVLEVPALHESPTIIPARNGAYIQVLLWVDLSNTPLASLPVVYESECEHGVLRTLGQEKGLTCAVCARLADTVNF